MSTIPRFPRPRAGSKIGDTAGITDRTVAKGGGSEVTPSPSASDNRTLATTYFTKGPVNGESTPILYNGDRLWAKVTVVLETAGPVAVGTAANLTPVLSGKGQLLQTNVPREFWISKGTRLFVAATGVNRLALTIEPAAWLEQIAGFLSGVLAGISAIASGKRSS